MNEGDIISISGVPGQWRVCETAPDGRVRLRPVDNPFNDALGEYWIVPSETLTTKVEQDEC